MKEAQVLALLQDHLHPTSIEYCLSLWRDKPFNLKISKSRQTKIGDFTIRKNVASPRITLNHDLNHYTFLLTYIHEVAHLHVYANYGNRVDPHGAEWKKTFQQLLYPVLSSEHFPPAILDHLIAHMQNPKASSFADVALTKALRSFDERAHADIVLSELPEGSIFKLSGRFFKKGKLRRTRVLCKEVNSRRQYLIPAEALVSDVQLSLL